MIDSIELLKNHINSKKLLIKKIQFGYSIFMIENELFFQKRKDANLMNHIDQKDNDTKSFEQTIYSTEELIGLMEAIERIGGQVLHTHGDAQGIHVQYDLRNKREE